MSTQSVVIGITAKSTGVDEELKKTKGKFDKLNQSLMSDKAQGAVQGMTKSLKGLSSMGDSLGGVFKNIVGGFSSMLSPIGLATAAIAGLITLGVNLYKKLTLSHEEYIDYLNHTMQNSKEKLSSVQKQQQTDNGYFERLKELNQVQTISNAVKTQTITIIQLLTRRYGDLGLSIDETTGKIIGLDGAFDRFQEKVSKLKLQELKNQADIAKRIADEQEKQVSKIGVIRDYRFQNAKTFDQVMTEQERKDFYSGDRKRRQKAIESATKREDERFARMPYENASQETMSEYNNIKERIASLQKKGKENGFWTYSEQQEFDELKARQEALEKIIKLQWQLSIVQGKIEETASDPQTNKKWKDYAASIRQAIQAQKEFNLQASKQQQGEQGRLRRAREAAIAQQKTNIKTQQDESAAQASIQREREARQQYYFSRMDKADQIAYYRKKNQKRNDELKIYEDVAKSQTSSGLDINKQYGATVAELEEKERNKTITNDEKKTLKMYRTIFGNRIHAYKSAWDEFNKLNDQIKKAQQEYAKTIDKPVQDWTDTEYEDFRQKHSALLAQRERASISIDTNSKNYDALKKRQEELTAKQKAGPLTASEFDELLEINKQIVAIQATIAATKKTQAQIDEQITKTANKRLQIQDALKDMFKDGQTALDAELALQEALAEGDIKAIERQKIINQLKAKGYDIDKMKKLGFNVDEDIDKLAQKNMQVNAVKYMNGQTKNLDRQIQLMQLKLQGKMDQIQTQRLLNELQDKGIKLSQEQIDKIIQKRKELKQLEFASSYQDQARGLIAQARSISLPRKQAMYENKKAEYEAKYGELTDKQLDRIKRLVDAQAMIQDFQAMAKPDFGKYDVKTNDLTARGGFQTGATIYADKDNVNKQIKNYAQKQTTLLSAIKQILEDGGTY